MKTASALRDELALAFAQLKSGKLGTASAAALQTHLRPAA